MHKNTMLNVSLGHLVPGLGVLIQQPEPGRWVATAATGERDETKGAATDPVKALTIALAKWIGPE